MSEILAPIAALTLPDSGALTDRARAQLAFIEEFQVDSPEQYQLAAEELQAIKRRAAAHEAQRTGITGPINKALAAINALFKPPADLLAQGEAILKRKMLAWTNEQERLAAEERARAEAVAAAERRRLEEEAAAATREAQAQAAAAAAAAAAGDQQAAALAQAAVQRAQAEAATAATTAQLVTAPITTIAPTKVAGISTRDKIDFEVTNLVDLIKHIAAHPELISLVRADEVKLRAYVKSLGTACNLPGVKVTTDKIMAARAA